MRKILTLLFAFALFSTSLVSLLACKPLYKNGTAYELAFEYRPETQTVTGVVKVKIENPFATPLDKIFFSLYPNAYRKDALYPAVAEGKREEVYYAGASYGEISVSSVQGAVGWSIEGDDENILSATLEKPLLDGETVVLDVGFSTRLPYAKHRLGVTEKSVNLGGFYPLLCPLTEDGFPLGGSSPVGDPFASDCADYTVSFTVPKEYAVAAAGEVVEEKVLESKKKCTMSLTNAREFAAVLSEDFRVVSDEKAGRRVEYYYLSDENPQKTLTAAVEALAYYSSAFGEYAYGRYTIAQTQLPFLGMEYTAFSMLGEGGTEEERLRAVAHEAAHQWWYAAVGSDQFENAWQDEGLAEYSAILFLEKKGRRREELVAASQKAYTEYAKTYLLALGWVDRRMTRPLVGYLSEYEYVCVSVHKAVFMFDELRKATGEKKFFAGLKKYYADNKFKRVQAAELSGAFERIGVDSFGFFDGFLNGKDG